MIELMGNTCLSGGAKGADIAWGDTARVHGHEVIHWEFVGHRSTAPETERRFLTADQLVVADEYLAAANRTLKRRWPVFNPHVANLLRRNYYQVAWSDACYAISYFDKKHVAGGTAWAVQMFVDRFPGQRSLCFVYDQKRRQWTQWDGDGFEEIDLPPAPSGVWAGVGTRDINDFGCAAIEEVFAQ